MRTQKVTAGSPAAVRRRIYQTLTLTPWQRRSIPITRTTHPACSLDLLTPFTPGTWSLPTWWPPAPISPRCALWYRPQNPFKPARGLLHEFDRYDMVKAAIADNYKLEVSDVEFHLPSASYTIDTLVVLSERNPTHRYTVILGEDNLEKFHPLEKSPDPAWSIWTIYLPKTRCNKTELHRHPNVRMVEAPQLDISATFIRQCIREKKSIRYLVPEPVEEMMPE